MVQMVHTPGSLGTWIWGKSECLWFRAGREKGEGLWVLLKVNAYGSKDTLACLRFCLNFLQQPFDYKKDCAFDTLPNLGRLGEEVQR
jgi:hypothetical protein